MSCKEAEYLLNNDENGSSKGYNTMGLYKQYLRVGQYARNQLFGIKPSNGTANNVTPIQMLISEQGKINTSRLTVIMLGLSTLAIGIILSSTPWLDYLILKNLRLFNGSISFQYWQKPGVIRLTKVYIFNVTNPDNFLNSGEKPKLQEVGPFVYREDMEKVNIKFHDNGTVTYQHKKILQFVPEMSVDKDQKLTVPNIPLLTLATQANSLAYFIQKSISFILHVGGYKPFVNITADELVFGYDDNLVSLAHQFYPKSKRPMSKMGLFLGRNGTLTEVQTVYTGMTGMQDFGLLNKLNGEDHLPYWSDAPCSDIRASEGSFFPPRYYTNADIVTLYDKDLCRIMPMQYRGPTTKQGIDADLYTPIDTFFSTVDEEPRNKCYCPGDEYCPPKGLQNISPCQYNAPVYLSYPHFYQADPSLMEPFEGLQPNKEKHETYFKIQPKLGVPVEGKVRVQLNLKIDNSPNVASVANFPSIVYPIMWVEEGIDELTPPIRAWILLATTIADVACPLITYGCIVMGSCILVGVFINAYKSLVFTKETIEIGMRNLRRGSAYITHPNRLVIRRDTYTLLDPNECPTPV